MKLRRKKGSHDRWEHHLRELRIDAAGNMEYIDDELEVDPELDDLLHSDGDKAADDRIALAFSCGGRESVFSIQPSGLLTIPADLHSCIDAIAAGERLRKNEHLEQELAGFVAMGTLELGEKLYYFSGYGKNLNTSLENSVPLKQIHIARGEDPRDTVIQMLDTGFSRWGRPSAYPVLVKYLHEYAQLEFEDEKISTPLQSPTENE